MIELCILAFEVCIQINFQYFDNRSELAQKVATDDLADHIMAFNTNYKDTGLFGVHAVVKVRLLSSILHFILMRLQKYWEIRRVK